MPDEGTLTEESLQAPSSPASETQPEPTSPELVTMETFQESMEAVGKQIAEGFKSNRQSQTGTIDNRVAGMEKRLTEKLIASLPEGTDVDALRREAYLDSQIAGDPAPTDARSGSPQAPDQPPASGANVVEQEIARILQEHGVSADNPELIEYVKANRGQPWYKVGAGFAELVEQIASRAGDPANIMGAGSGGSVSTPDLRTAYLAEVQALREKGAHARDLRPVQDKYMSQGLNVYQIDLTTGKDWVPKDLDPQGS